AFLSLLLIFLHGTAPHRDLHSFPTRRSSDLRKASAHSATDEEIRMTSAEPFEAPVVESLSVRVVVDSVFDQFMPKATHPMVAIRSEEHTSELQSRSDLVCRLLLEKKKKNNKH